MEEDGGSLNSPLEQRGCERMASPWVAGVKIVGRKLKMIWDKSRGVEKLLKDSFSMDSGGQGRRKEKKKIRG